MKIKSNSFLICLIAFFAIHNFVFCQQKQFTIEKHFDALNKHNITDLQNLFSEDAKIESTGFDSIKIGGAGVKEIYSRYFKSSPDLKYKIINIIYSDNDAVVEYFSTGTMVNVEDKFSEFMKGKVYTLKNCTIFKFKGDKIIKSSTYFDQLSFLRQMKYFDQKNK